MVLDIEMNEHKFFWCIFLVCSEIEVLLLNGV